MRRRFQCRGWESNYCLNCVMGPEAIEEALIDWLINRVTGMKIGCFLIPVRKTKKDQDSTMDALFSLSRYMTKPRRDHVSRKISKTTDPHAQGDSLLRQQIFEGKLSVSPHFLHHYQDNFNTQILLEDKLSLKTLGVYIFNIFWS